jgi:hypothetical protein
LVLGNSAHLERSVTKFQKKLSGTPQLVPKNLLGSRANLASSEAIDFSQLSPMSFPTFPGRRWRKKDSWKP